MDPLRYGLPKLLLLLVMLFRFTAGAQEAQIEQSRQFSTVLPSPSHPSEASGAGLAFAAPEHPDDAFGAQVLMKSQERPKPFTGFAEIGAFFTNNVGLTRSNAHSDAFLVGTLGAGFTQRLGPDLRLDIGARGAAYRYGKFSGLDFQSLDLTAALTWSPPQLGGAEVSLRYTFTDLTTASRTREFYRNHAVLLGVQKTIAFSRAHGVYFGASAQWSEADPSETGRDEYVGYAGYRAHLTRSIDADVSYRYGRYIYREGRDRQDNNHTVSAAVRYSPRDWVIFSATTFASWNRSSRREFDYDAANVGVGAQVSIRF